jgi:hypothetical protein
MERGAWTEERLDDLAGEMRRGFDRVDRDIRDTRTDLHAEIAATRTDLTTQIDGLRQTMLRIGGGMIAGMSVGFLSVLAAILARGT